MFVYFTVSADSHTWKSSFRPDAVDAHPSVKALSADLLVSAVEFLNLENIFSVGKTAGGHDMLQTDTLGNW